MSFGEILVKKKIITNDLLIESKKKSEKEGLFLDDILLSQGVSEDDILNAKSESFSIPLKKISPNTQVPFEVLKNIPEESARHYKFVPLGFKDGVMDVGVVHPDDLEAREALQFLSSRLNLPFKIFLISKDTLEVVLKDYKSLGGEAVKVLGELETTISAQALPQEEQKRAGVTLTEEAPVTKMVAVVLRHAIEGRASDIHIEPTHDRLKVRFRVDGVLHTSLMLPADVHDAIVSRMKILTKMKIDEKRRPQDGRFEANIAEQRIDFRVSTFPCFFGEKIVVRILDPSKALKTLPDVGLTGRNLSKVEEILHRPYGLVLLTGPTGSGKTTTLYAMLRMLDREKFNVISLEDPIEYNLEGVSQSQVRPEIGYDFANGLRHVLRQDPDMIMVGEIRDKETAQLAIQAALTGHLVFSTLHTNTAIGAIPRLIDMGVDPFLVPSTLVLSIAQRLTRTLCPEAKKALTVEGAVKEKIDAELKGFPDIVREKISVPKEIYQAQPSAICPRGTRGRTGLFEVLKMTPSLEKIILTKPSESSIMEEANKQGMTTMRQDGLLKVFDGIIGLEELNETLSIEE